MRAPRKAPDPRARPAPDMDVHERFTAFLRAHEAEALRRLAAQTDRDLLMPEMPQSPDPQAPIAPRPLAPAPGTKATTGHDVRLAEIGGYAAVARDRGPDVWRPLLRIVLRELLPAMPRAVRSVAAILLRML